MDLTLLSASTSEIPALLAWEYDKFLCSPEACHSDPRILTLKYSSLKATEPHSLISLTGDVQRIFILIASCNSSVLGILH